MVESEMVVRRLLASSWRIHSLFLSPQKYERLAPHIHDPTIQVFVADVSVMSTITGFHIHRGALALVHRPSAESLKVEQLINTLQSKQDISICSLKELQMWTTWAHYFAMPQHSG